MADIIILILRCRFPWALAAIAGVIFAVVGAVAGIIADDWADKPELIFASR
jgi:hypothetical protein